MSKLKILKGGVELANESGAVAFNTDWQLFPNVTSGKRPLVLTANFPNTLNSQKDMTLEVSNSGVDAAAGQEIDKITSGTEDGIEEEMSWKYFRFRYTILGGAPTGNITSINAEIK